MAAQLFRIGYKWEAIRAAARGNDSGTGSVESSDAY
jgi:hypothetical protein